MDRQQSIAGSRRVFGREWALDASVVHLAAGIVGRGKSFLGSPESGGR
jgi:hypothetical protein